MLIKRSLLAFSNRIAKYVYHVAVWRRWHHIIKKLWMQRARSLYRHSMNNLLYTTSQSKEFNDSRKWANASDEHSVIVCVCVLCIDVNGKWLFHYVSVTFVFGLLQQQQQQQYTPKSTSLMPVDCEPCTEICSIRCRFHFHFHWIEMFSHCYRSC